MPLTPAEFYDIQLCAKHTDSYVRRVCETEGRKLSISRTLARLLTTPDGQRCTDLRRSGVPSHLAIYAAAMESPELSEQELAMLHEAYARLTL